MKILMVNYSKRLLDIFSNFLLVCRHATCRYGLKVNFTSLSQATFSLSLPFFLSFFLTLNSHFLITTE